MSNSKKTIFLFYDGRSGSTYLSGLLNQYTDVCVSAEQHFLSRFLILKKEHFDSENDVLNILKSLKNDKHFLDLNIPQSKWIEHVKSIHFPASVSDAAQSLVDFYFSFHHFNESIRIIKFSPFFHQKQLDKLFPEAQKILLIRDGRGVFVSKRKSKTTAGLTFGGNLLLSATDWKNKMAAAFFNNFIKIRYENLIQNETHEIESLLRTIGVQNPEKTKTKEAYFNRIGSHQQQLHPNITSLPITEKANEWKAILSETEIALYEEIAHNELQTLGYKLQKTTYKKGLKYYSLLFFLKIEAVLIKMKHFLYILVKGNLLVAIKLKISK